MAQTWRVFPASTKSASKSGRPALDRAALDRLALGYAGRYATSRARLRDYLQRKLDQHGWVDGEPRSADAERARDAVVARMAELGYVDDQAFARMRSEGLARRGYGQRRVTAALANAGIAADDADDAMRAVEADPFDIALAFARRRRIGPFDAQRLDPDRRRRAIAALMRAGHDYGIAQRVVDAEIRDENETIG